MTRDSALHPVITAVLADPAGDHTVATMAPRAHVSSRHLARLFADELSTTPTRWLQEIRLGLAQTRLLEGAGVLEAAHASGLGSDDTLRRLLHRTHGLTPREYVRRFATTR